MIRREGKLTRLSFAENQSVHGKRHGFGIVRIGGFGLFRDMKILAGSVVFSVMGLGGAAVAMTLVADGGKIRHFSCVGMADIEAKKPVTATAVMMMQEAGKLSVEDPVAKYLPEFSDLKDTTFYPTEKQQERLATSYRRTDDGALEKVSIWAFGGKRLSDRNRIPLGNGGLFSTAPDYVKFCQMILNGGELGTQVWLDPVKERVDLLMVQRSNFPNSDASDVRKALHEGAAKS